MTVGVQNNEDTSKPGHKLDEEQKTALDTFVRLCEDNELLGRLDGMGERDVLDAINDETALIRFLRARKFDPEPAINQFFEAILFRKEKGIFEVYDGIRVEDFETANAVYPQWTGRLDKRGLPIFFVATSNIKPSMLGFSGFNYGYVPSSDSDSDPPSTEPNQQHQRIDVLQLGSVMFDSYTRFVFPLCSVAAQKQVTSAVILVDAATLTLKQGFDLRNFAKEATWLLSTCYPETVDKIFVCNCPSYFGAIWKILKGWVDPITAAKLVFLAPAEVYPTLKEYIDDDDLPIKVGGKLDFEHGGPVDLSDAFKKALGRDQLVAGPHKWVYDEKGRRSVVAVGSVDGKLRYEVVATLNESLDSGPEE
ncbi:CRAL/TRIO domain-containing protein [Aspergillus steynii IBT 23096]|uniref:CRAL/TRIO domain-containing protein n=1 Tax=Aspergillus steynii IBT 23096 TaxID=1392250 RepID=A0A2I2FUH7_9EURO|nr:CRAL/TRIO domain-containing protein [Aspergillus steynii IBT 23096]PLB44299.1 CRAL/TRIO domain-containing protein [Aspergillus steynii IBT 23096]